MLFLDTHSREIYRELSPGTSSDYVLSYLTAKGVKPFLSESEQQIVATFRSFPVGFLISVQMVVIVRLDADQRVQYTEIREYGIGL